MKKCSSWLNWLVANMTQMVRNNKIVKSVVKNIFYSVYVTHYIPDPPQSSTHVLSVKSSSSSTLFFVIITLHFNPVTIIITGNTCLEQQKTHINMPNQGKHYRYSIWFVFHTPTTTVTEVYIPARQTKQNLKKNFWILSSDYSLWHI